MPESTNYEKFFRKQMQIPPEKKEYNALAPEYSIIRAIINARKESGLTQKELSARCGIAQSDISKLENGNANPSVRTLQRIANALGKTLKIEFA